MVIVVFRYGWSELTHGQSNRLMSACVIPFTVHVRPLGLGV